MAVNLFGSAIVGDSASAVDFITNILHGRPRAQVCKPGKRFVQRYR